MNLSAFDTYCSKPFLGANTSSSHLHTLWLANVSLGPPPSGEVRITENQRHLPSTALVSEVVLEWSTNLSLVQEGTVHELVQ